MKKFKSIFYGIYILFFIFLAFIALNYENIVLNWDWDGIDTWTGLLRFVLQLGGIGSVLFIAEIIVENIHLFAKSRKIKSLEIQVLDLKAKLYDQDKPIEAPAPEPSPTIAPNPEKEESK
jgi:hypothetical protein